MLFNSLTESSPFLFHPGTEVFECLHQRPDVTSGDSREMRTERRMRVYVELRGTVIPRASYSIAFVTCDLLP